MFGYDISVRPSDPEYDEYIRASATASYMAGGQYNDYLRSDFSEGELAKMDAGCVRMREIERIVGQRKMAAIPAMSIARAQEIFDEIAARFGGVNPYRLRLDDSPSNWRDPWLLELNGALIRKYEPQLEEGWESEAVFYLRRAGIVPERPKIVNLTGKTIEFFDRLMPLSYYGVPPIYGKPRYNGVTGIERREGTVMVAVRHWKTGALTCEERFLPKGGRLEYHWNFLNEMKKKNPDAIFVGEGFRGLVEDEEHPGRYRDDVWK
jgi:hypothetical protein